MTEYHTVTNCSMAIYPTVSLSMEWGLTTSTLAIAFAHAPNVMNINSHFPPYVPIIYKLQKVTHLYKLTT